MLEQMDFVMCVDVMPTDITMYADILLPDTSYLERYDMIKTGTQWDFAEEHKQYIAPRMPLVAPGFERKESIWITNEIAKRMGYGDKIPVQSQEEAIDKMLAGVKLSIDKIKAEDGIHIQPGKDPYGEMEDHGAVPQPGTGGERLSAHPHLHPGGTSPRGLYAACSTAARRCTPSTAARTTPG